MADRPRQGIAVDQSKGFMYFSFTNLLVKTDLAGKPVGSVTGFTGHLGDLDFNRRDGRVYGSLEYKAAKAFYIAIFDVDQITSLDMNAETAERLTAVYLTEVVEDYTADMNGDGIFDGDTANTAGPPLRLQRHRRRRLRPRVRQRGGADKLTVAYGIYANTGRQDNDHQVLLQYDIKRVARVRAPAHPDRPAHRGPRPSPTASTSSTPATRTTACRTWSTTLARQLVHGRLQGHQAAVPELQPVRGRRRGPRPRWPHCRAWLGSRACSCRSRPTVSSTRPPAFAAGVRRPTSASRRSVTGSSTSRRTATQGGNETATLRLEAWTGDANDPFAPVTAPTTAPAPLPARASAATWPPRSRSPSTAPRRFGAFTPGIERDYTAGTGRDVTSTAGDATLSVSEAGQLTNGPFRLASPLAVELSRTTWAAPVSNDRVAVTFKQHIGSSEPLRTGDYGKAVTLTLSTTTP